MNDHISENADSPHAGDSNMSAHAAPRAVTAPETSNVTNAGPEHRIISRVVQAAIASFCHVLSEPMPPDFLHLSPSEADTHEKKVLALRGYPNHTPEELHGSWTKDKAYKGWQAGEVYDEAAKKDPAMLPYEQLPVNEKRKLALFMGLVTAMPTARPAQPSQEPSEKGDLSPSKPALELPETEITGIAEVAHAAVVEYEAAAAGVTNPSWDNTAPEMRSGFEEAVKTLLDNDPGSVVADQAVWKALGYTEAPLSTDTNAIEEMGIIAAVVRALTKSF